MGEDCTLMECIGTTLVKHPIEKYQEQHCEYTWEDCIDLPAFDGYEPPGPGECCGKCTVEKTPAATCEVHNATKMLSAKKPDSNVVCYTKTPVFISYCKGTCDSSFSGAIRFSSQSEASVPSQVDCKCCTGDGREETMVFDCDGVSTNFEVTQMYACHCEACQAIGGGANGGGGGNNGNENGGGNNENDIENTGFGTGIGGNFGALGAGDFNIPI